MSVIDRAEALLVLRAQAGDLEALGELLVGAASLTSRLDDCTRRILQAVSVPPE